MKQRRKSRQKIRKNLKRQQQPSKFFITFSFKQPHWEIEIMGKECSWLSKRLWGGTKYELPKNARV